MVLWKDIVNDPGQEGCHEQFGFLKCLAFIIAYT